VDPIIMHEPPPPRPTIRPVALANLRPHPRRYRAHPDDQVAHLMAAIRAVGFYRNVVIARDGTVLAGHGMVEAARRLGMSKVPAARLDVAPDEPAALKVLAGDNGIAHLAEQDDRALTELLKEIRLGR
jgi:ParB-like chromosome segregation protein Spo0J